jgi:hypothetical protein
MAVQPLFGHYTCSLNLCPSELGSEWTFAMAGKKYSFDALGMASDRPHVKQCQRIVAENPVACAEMIHAYMQAFAEIFLGWPMDAERQDNPDCIFGVILAAYLKYESSTRGGKHGHGQICQPALQAQRLKAMLEDAPMFQYQLHGFMEAVMMAFFPTPAYSFWQEAPADVDKFPPLARGAHFGLTGARHVHDCKGGLRELFCAVMATYLLSHFHVIYPWFWSRCTGDAAMGLVQMGPRGGRLCRATEV